MITAWRLVKKKRASTAFDGQGSVLFGGRWNSPGVRVVYLSRTLSLGALENFVHLTATMAKGLLYATFEVDLDEADIETVAASSLPADWRNEPAPTSTQKIGDDWVAAGSSAVLSVPSVIVPKERNYVLNNAHPSFSTIAPTQMDDFSYDPRMWK